MSLGFKIYPSSYFTPGKVFKVLWSEPKGETAGSKNDIAPDIATLTNQYGEKVYNSIRRFVVIGTFLGHSQCLPIYTYGSQGLLKKGVVAHYHARIFTEDNNPSELELEERRLLTRDPIRVIPKTPRDKLERMSRLNYSKIYTVEHNVKIRPVGWVAKECEKVLAENFDDVHRPLAETWGRSANKRQSGNDAEYRQIGESKALTITTEYVPSKGKETMKGWWKCCLCSRESDPSFYGESCPDCGHAKCNWYCTNL